jgi:DNA mismatch repair protein MutS
MLKRWMALPIKEIQPLNERYNVVDYFLKHPNFRDHVEDNIRHIGILND